MLRKKGKIVLMMLIFFGFLLLLLMSPLFAVTEVTVVGNSKLAKERIMSASGINLGMNIFRFSPRKGEETLLLENYVKSAIISVILPNKVNIEIVERKTCGYVPYMGTYLYIDSDGYVLENSDITDEPCPVVTGLKFAEFTVGEQLSVDNYEAFDIVLTMSGVLLNYGYLDTVKEMNISNPEDIHLYIGSVDVFFGDIIDADKKIRTIIEIMKNISEGDKGTLHIEDLKNPPYFTYTL